MADRQIGTDDDVGMAQTMLTVIGTVLSLLGTACAVIAYVGTWQEHGEGPLLPRLAAWVSRAQRRIRKLFGKRQHHVLGIGTALEIEASMSATGTVSGPVIPGDADLERRVELLIRRVECIERQAVQDRSQHVRDLAGLRGAVDKAALEASQAAADVEATAKAMVLDSVRIQLLGLLLVGTGTVILAAAGFMG